MRTDGDTWDIVNSVGLTALGVATFRALETEQPEPLIRDDYARLFVEAAGDAHFVGLLADPSSLGDTPLFPGFMGIRTRYFDEFFSAAGAAGVRQAVIVAAGLDARAYRLEWPAGTTVFEIDQPKVLEFKDRVLADHGARPKTDRRPVSVDLRDDWPAALVDAGFDSDKPTAWSAEGLLPYLPGAAQDALFERIDKLSAAESWLAVEGFVGGADIKRFEGIEQTYFDKSPFGDLDVTQLFYYDDRAEPAEWLTKHGWSVQDSSLEDLSAAYGRPLADLPEELADISQLSRYFTARKPMIRDDIA